MIRYYVASMADGFKQRILRSETLYEEHLGSCSVHALVADGGSGYLKGCLVTIDAAGCQTDIATKIIDANADYLLSVRDNQPKLSAAVQAQFDAASESTFSNAKAHATTTETRCGRTETRECWVLSIPDDLPEAERWKNLAQIVRFDSERTIDGTTTRGTRWFITSRKTLTAKQALAAVRGHWQIANKLHWSLDVAFREDDSRLRAENAAENFGVVRHVALNLLRNVDSKVGIKNRRLKAGWSDDFLTQVLVSHAD